MTATMRALDEDHPRYQGGGGVGAGDEAPQRLDGRTLTAAILNAEPVRVSTDEIMTGGRPAGGAGVIDRALGYQAP